MHCYVISGRLVLSHSAGFTGAFIPRCGRMMAQSTTTRRSGQRMGGGGAQPAAVVLQETRRAPPAFRTRGEATHQSQSSAQPNHSPGGHATPGPVRQEGLVAACCDA